MERFERLRFSVPAVPLSKEGLLCVSAQFSREDGSGFVFGSWKTVPAVPVPLSVSGKTVPTVPVRFLGHPAYQRKFLRVRRGLRLSAPIARFGAIAICDSNRESQITSDSKGSALRFCCDLKKASNHKSHDLNCDLKRFSTF